MNKKQRVINALGVLKKDAPEVWKEIVDGGVCCPHNAGLDSAHRDDCEINVFGKPFVMRYCAECWRLALEAKS